MKMVLGLLMAVLIASCSGGGGGGGVQDIGEVQEGEGPALDVSNVTELQLTVKKAIYIAESGFSDSGSASSSGSTGSSGGASSAVGGISSKGMFADKASMGPSAEILKLCRDGSFTKDYGEKVIEGSSGKAVLSGQLTAKKTSDDTAAGQGMLSVVFEDFASPHSYVSTTQAKSFSVSGNAAKETTATVTKGLKAMCDAILAGQTSSRDAPFSQTTKDHVSAALTLSGGLGGAITFDFTRDLTISTDGQLDFSASGSAHFKSGGKQVDCTISRSGDVVDADTEVICK